jgi:hypothetical protein
MDHHYIPDGSHRHPDIEKVQREILQQHKYIETQLNALRDNIRTMCTSDGRGGLRCGTDYMVNTGGVDMVNGRAVDCGGLNRAQCNLNRTPSAYINGRPRNINNRNKHIF